MINIKIAVLSDIHGNIVALKAAIKDAKKNNVDEYIIAGDLITDFPAANEVIDIIKPLTPYVIKGNREKYIELYDKTKQEEMWNLMQNIDFIYNYEILTKENMEYIKNLKDTLEIKIQNYNIKVVHGSLYHISDIIDLYDKQLVDKISKELKEDILIFGHSHEKADHIKINNKILVQAGVIGTHDNPQNKSEYTIIEIKDNKLDIITRQIEYNKEELKEIIKRSGILERSPVWVNLCYYTIVKNENIKVKFVKEGIKLMKEKYGKEKKSKIEKNFRVIEDDIYKQLWKKYEKYFII
ncbi:MAG: hypothetical protein HFJ53_01770 [Clostridia bacterium]|nr:hypothetical protein [Clostridia bacterium]